MSRIHEALKKAQLEQAARQGTTPEVLPPPSMVAPGGQNCTNERANAVPPNAFRTAGAAGSFLRFETIREHSSNTKWYPNSNVLFFLSNEHNSVLTEQFRMLRSRLYRLRDSQAVRTLLITSAAPADGKTFVATNLAHAISRQHDRRVLLIDADLRCSRLHVPFGAPSSPGLSDYLLGKAEELDVIQCGLNDNLCLIPGGNVVDNPAELLTDDRFQKLLDCLAPAFDWIIVDSPPTTPVSDALLLGDRCDAVLVVVRAGVTPFEMAHRTCQEFRDKNLVGVVLNAAEEVRGRSHEYWQYYRSGKGSE